jgi:hypothetical protein
MGRIKDIIDKIKYGVGVSIAGADSAVFSTNKGQDSNVVVVSQKEQGSALMQAMLKGEITQEVEDLRYRTYLIEEESGKNEVIGIGEEDMVSFAIPAQFNKPKIEEIETDFKTVLTQNVDAVSTGINDNVQDENGFINKIKEYYPLTIERDCMSRFPIEKYCHQIVVKEKDGLYQLDLYFTIYPDTIDRIKRMFTNEIQKLYDKKIRMNDVNDIQTIQFTTNKAWGMDDNKLFKFKIDSYKECSKFNGYYILKFYAESLIYGEKITDKYFSQNIRKKYDENEKRPNMNIPLNVFTEEEKVEKCDKCGREIKGLELSDYYITKHDFGIGMCQECTSKFLFENKEK